MGETENGMTISKASNKISEALFFSLFLVTIPVAMVLYESTSIMITVVILWEVVFAYRFYQILIGQNTISVDFQTRNMKIENENWVLKHFTSSDSIDLFEPLEYSIRNIRHSRFGFPSYRLKVRNTDSKKIIVCDFENLDMAKRVKFLLKSLSNKTAGNNGYN